MLDPIHHQGLRLATGAFRTSRIESLYCESGEPSLYQRRNMLLCSYGVKLRAQPEHNTYKHFHSMALDFRYRRDPRRPRPAGVRFREGLSELDIRLPNIKVLFHSLLSSGSDVGVVWVPGHVGIRGNETADAGARDAALNGTLVYWRERWQDVVTYIRNCIRRDWEEKWSAQAGNKLRPIKNTVREWDSSSRASRRDEVILTRLRIGHCRLTHGHLLSGEPPPECDTCHALLTVEHFLLHCRKYDLPRRQYAIRPTLRDALGNDFNCVNAVLSLHPGKTLAVWLLAGFITSFLGIAIAALAPISATTLLQQLRNSFFRGMGQYLSDSEWKTTFDILQQELGCCGTLSYTDWHRVSWINIDLLREDSQTVLRDSEVDGRVLPPVVPWSCCNPSVRFPCFHDKLQQSQSIKIWQDLVLDSLYTEGCLQVLRPSVQRAMDGAIGICVLIFLLQTFEMAGHVAHMGESRNAYRVLVGRSEGKRPLERPRRKWEDNIKMDLREVRYDDKDWINLAQDRTYEHYLQNKTVSSQFTVRLPWLVLLARSLTQVHCTLNPRLPDNSSLHFEPKTSGCVALTWTLPHYSSSLYFEPKTSGRVALTWTLPQYSLKFTVLRTQDFHWIRLAFSQLTLAIAIIVRYLYTASRNSVIIGDPTVSAYGWLFGRGDCLYKSGLTMKELDEMRSQQKALIKRGKGAGKENKKKKKYKDLETYEEDTTNEEQERSKLLKWKKSSRKQNSEDKKFD
ncbi:hypothetical protein ANN_09448 [Periplaneta americana]|uniref:RNase H type-1 domain-containing protein n=1 Tax=Periplaneta americana TaxID=6978 RepID=A0ABQ8TMV2_PERAM|nr:hypothetical protein ANN_09448 [Periplaneta americana]